jgi:dienelactone hydrolase
MTNMRPKGKKRAIIANLLTGRNEFPEESVYVRKSPGMRIDDVWAIPVKYESRSHPSYGTREDGETFMLYRTDDIPGLLLEPKKPKYKGVLALHQHALEFGLGKSEVAGLRAGKSGDTQGYGLGLAKIGYSVLCFDFLPFEERMLAHENTRDYWGERFVKQELSLDGVEPMGIHVLDAMRGVDVLHNEGLDAVGVIGHSLGGMVAVYSMACDDRIRTGVSNCGIATLESVRNGSIVHNWAWSVHGLKREFGEIHNLFGLIAERPVLVSAARNDKNFPIEGTRRCVRWGRDQYHDKRLLESYEFDGKHDFPREARENAYRFLDENL